VKSERNWAEGRVLFITIRKTFGRIVEPLRINEAPKIKLGEFLGLFAADGCFYTDLKRYHYTLTITLYIKASTPSLSAK